MADAAAAGNGADAATTALVGVYMAQAASAIVHLSLTESTASIRWTGLHRGLVDPSWPKAPCVVTSAPGIRHATAG
jgi:hypothetical protein